jgi:hypothetical protein
VQGMKARVAIRKERREKEERKKNGEMMARGWDGRREVRS